MQSLLYKRMKCISEITEKFVIVLMCCVFALYSAESLAFESEAKPIIRVGITKDLLTGPGLKVINGTTERLKDTFPEYNFKVSVLSKSELRTAIEKDQVDYFIASSGFYLYSAIMDGAIHIATLRGMQTSTYKHAMGAVFVTRADNKDLHILNDLWNKRVSVVGPNNFYSWFVTRHEVGKLTKYPDTWFGKIIFTDDDDFKAVDLMLKGSSDAAVLPTCRLEELINTSQIQAKDVRIIDERHYDGYRCKVSTPLFSGSVLGATSTMSEQINRKVSVALLSAEFPEENFCWNISDDFREELYLLEHYGLPPYVNKNIATEHNVRRYMDAIIIGCMLLFAAMGYIFIIRKTVATTTRELRKANEEKNQLERSGVVSGLSSLIAHEIRQPLTSLTSYAEGLQRYLESSNDEIVNEATEAIQNEARRISAIVENVRAYAKQSKRPLARHNLVDIITKARRSVIAAKGNDVSIFLSLPSSAFVHCEPLEIELLFANIIQNAVQSCKSEANAYVSVELVEEKENWKITVEDNGPVISDEKLSKLSHPMSSQKIDGLGLGLSICRTIVVKHNGSMKFKRNNPKGLLVIVSIRKTLSAPVTDHDREEFNNAE